MSEDMSEYLSSDLFSLPLFGYIIVDGIGYGNKLYDIMQKRSTKMSLRKDALSVSL